MDTVDLIIKSSTEFYNDLRADENGRYRSWEHCYSHFMNARGRNDVDYDYLSPPNFPIRYLFLSALRLGR